MEEIMTLHCGHENCNLYYEYNNNEDSIVAICASWHHEKSKRDNDAGLLAHQPIIEETYEIAIHFPLKINLTQHFWVTYFDPYSESNGLDSEEGIEAMLFCQCQKKNIIDCENYRANLEIKVINIIKVAERSTAKIEINKRTKLLDTEINSKSVSVENFEHFSIIRANYQSNLGWTYIIEKKHGKCIIVAEEDWDMHKQIWRRTYEELSKEQVYKYGIQ